MYQQDLGISYYHILEHLPDLVCCYSVDTIITYANQTYCNYFGISRENLVGTSFLTYLPENYATSIADQVKSMWHTKESFVETHPSYCVDGSVRWQEWTNQILCDSAGQIICGVGVGRDITEQKQLEQRLEQQKQQYRHIVEQSPHPIFIVSSSGHLEMWTSACIQQFGYLPEDILEHSIDNLLHETNPTAIAPLVQQVFSGQVIHEVDLVYRRRNGQAMEMVSRLYPLHDEQGRIKSCVISSVDVSDRKRTEQSLQQSETRLQAIFHQNSVGMSLTNLKGEFLDVNSAFCRLVGYDKSDILSMTFYDLTCREDLGREAALYQQLMNGKIPSYSIEKRFLTKQAEYRWAAVHVSGLAHPSALPELMVSVVEDITHRKRMEIALKNSQYRYEMAVIAGKVGIWDWNMQTNEVYLDASLKDMLGYGDRTILYMDEWSALVYESDRPLVQQALDTYLAGHTDLFEVEHRMVHKDQSLRWFLARGTVTRDRDGNPIRLMGTDSDITERKLIELQIQTQIQRESLLNQVIRSIRNSLDLDTVFATIVQGLNALLPVAHIHIWKISADGRNFVNSINYPIHKQAHDPALNLSELELPVDNPVLQGFLQQMGQVRTIIVDDPSCLEDPLYQRLAIAFPGDWLMSLLDIELDIQKYISPAQAQRTCWGVLVLIKEPNTAPWTPTEAALADAIADQLSIAIQQSELYAKLQSMNLTLEDTVRQRTAQLNQSLEFEALLKRITDKVRDSLDEQTILQVAVQELSDVLQTITCDAALYDLNCRTSTIISESVTPGIPIRHGATIAMADEPALYSILLSGEPLHYCGYESYSCLRPHQERVLIFAQPMLDDQGVIGDMWLYRSSDRPFSAIEIRLICQVVNQCAIALRQSKLYHASRIQVQELEKLNQLKDDFLSTVSHELRSPMANINMATQMLEIVLAHHKEEDTRIEQYLKILREQCNQELNLINDLLDLQHLDAGTQLIDATEVRLHEWIPHIVESFEIRTISQQQHLSTNINQNLAPVTIDISMLTRIVVELLNNACKYTPPDHDITVRVWQKGDRWHLQVENTGITIPVHEQQRIFDKFYRIVSSDRWKHGGTGLGLTLVKGLVTCLNGKIEVSSKQNVTAFTLTFPTDVRMLPPHSRSSLPSNHE